MRRGEVTTREPRTGREEPGEAREDGGEGVRRRGGEETTAVPVSVCYLLTVGQEVSFVSLRDIHRLFGSQGEAFVVGQSPYAA